MSLEDGIAILEIDREVLEPEHLQEHVDFMLGISQQMGQVAMPVMMDLGALRWIGWQARVCGAELTRPEWNTKFALLWRNPVQRVIAAFFLGINKPPCPSMTFGERAAAIAWLKEPVGEDEPLRASDEVSEGRLGQTADALVRIGMGDLSVQPSMTDAQDELDAITCGLAMLSEELGGLFAERDDIETEARKHRRKLELIVQERTNELLEVNEVLKHEIEVRKGTEERLREINEELNSFAETVSHDLKGPLSVIRSASDTMSLVVSQSSGAEAENAKDLADIISRNTGKATALIEDILALAEAGQLPAETEEVDIGDMVDLVRDEASSLIRRRGVVFDVSDDLGSVIASRTHMYQVFANVITNMLQYNDSDRPVVTIRALSAHHSEHRFLVRDNGSGIPQEDLENIFEPFFKGESGRTGLGLSTVRKIVEVYSGGILAYNDGGACFEITLHDYKPPIVN